MSVENVSSGLVPQGQKASDYDNSDPVPPRQNVVPSAEKTDSSQQGLEFLFSPLLEEYYNPTHGQAEENNNDQAPNASFQEVEFINPFCTRVQEIEISPFEQVRGNLQPCQFKTRRQLAKDPEMCIVRRYSEYCERRTLRRHMADYCMDRRPMQDVTQQFGQVMLRKRVLILEESFAPVARLEAEVVYVAHQEGFVDQIHPDNVYLLEALYGLMQAPRACKQTLVQAVCYCARYQARPTQKHLKEVKRIFKYLKGTINMGLWYPKDSGFELTAFSDADHAGCLDTRKSTSGGIQFLGDKLVSWMSKKQNCTAMSSAEAEYVALSASLTQVMWMRTQLQDYGFNYNKIPLYCDSQSAIAISCNPVQHSRTKHIHTRYHFIKEQVENGIIELYFVRTEYQLADMFTKALPEDRFKYLVRRIGMRCLTLADLEVLTNETA
ncbi:hypothetical protein Tco_0639701 [Tanacetum coccineum]